MAAACGAVAAAAAWAGEAEVIASARPSVVAVGSFRAVDNPRFTFRGSGFVIGDGTLVVTNAHVLPDVAEPGMRLMVLTPRGKDNPEPRDATVIGTARGTDLALLKIEGAPLPALALAPPEPVAEGTGIVLIGFPLGGVLGFRPVSHRGMVSSLTPVVGPAPNSAQLNDQAIALLRRGGFDVYQLDATAYPGNSGGPLLDAASGRVIGVVNMVFVKGAKESALSQPSGITYALPVRLVHELVEQAGKGAAARPAGPR